MRVYLVFLILPVGMVTACHHTSSNNDVSLLSYTDQKDLNDRGLTIEKINMLNMAHDFEFGYPRYDEYERHKINSFDILVSKNDPNELYVIKKGKLLLDVDESLIRLYKSNTTYPNPSDTSVFFSSEIPSVLISGDSSTYYDLGLDGVDIVSKKIPYKGKYNFNNYEDVSEVVPNRTISKAFNGDLKCEPLYANIACCLNNDDKYDVYNFKYNKGWVLVPESRTLKQQCNSDDIEKTRNKLVEQIYGDL